MREIYRLYTHYEAPLKSPLPFFGAMLAILFVVTKRFSNQGVLAHLPCNSTLATQSPLFSRRPKVTKITNYLSNFENLR